MTDETFKRAMAKIEAKYLKGMAEHDGGMDKAGLTRKQWLECLQEEAIDTVFYCEVLLGMED